MYVPWIFVGFLHYLSPHNNSSSKDLQTELGNKWFSCPTKLFEVSYI